MPETVQFRNVILRHFQSPPQGETTPFIRSHWTADFAEPSNQEMGWSNPDSCGVAMAKLVGEILNANIVVTPHAPEMEKFEVQIQAHEINDFQLHTVKDEDSCHKEVRFTMRSNTRSVGACLEDYRWNVGDAPASMKVTFDRVSADNHDERQEGLDFGATDEDKAANLARADHGPVSEDELMSEFGPEDGPCIACNNRIPFEDGSNKQRHATGQSCARATASGTVASAVEAAGGTTSDLKKRRGRPRRDEMPVGNPTLEERQALDAQLGEYTGQEDYEGSDEPPVDLTLM